MNVLVVGGGSREHALAWKLAGSPQIGELLVAPGNAGTAAFARNVPVAAMDFEGVYRAAREHRVDLVVVGPEDPLAAGLVDFLAERGVLTYGPSRDAARIEASKSFAKALMERAGIPTAAHRTFDSVDAALGWLSELEAEGAPPPVVKADGLAAGKGVAVAANFAEARAAVRAAMVEGAFGAAGSRVVLEERLTGTEVSAHAFCDGAHAVPMVFACDYKRVRDHDEGPNTGGMGVYSPPGFVDAVLAEQITTTITQPTVRALAEAGSPYRGTLYPGLMITPSGPKVIEFNCRFGDPETQVLLPRLDCDLLPVLEACARGTLTGVAVRWSERAAVGVVLASGGYPGPYRTGLPISGLDTVDSDILVFHAGTKRGEDGMVLTNGGRVLTIVATAPTLAEARERVYENAHRIHFEGVHYRTDIALRELPAEVRA